MASLAYGVNVVTYTRQLGQWWSQASIRTRLMTALMVLALVPLAIVATMAYETSQDILKANATTKLEELAAQAVEKIDRLIFTRSQDMQAWVTMDAFQDAIADDPDGRITLTLVRLWSQYGHQTAIYCLNQLGRIVASNDVSLLDRNVGREAWFRNGTKSPGLVVNDLAYDPLTKSLAVRLMVPIMASHDDQLVIGYLVAHVSYDELREMIQQIKVHDGGQSQTAHVVVANTQGSLIVGPAFLIDDTPTSSFPSVSVADVGYVSNRSEGASARGAFLTADSRRLVGYATSSGFRTYEGLNWKTLVVQDSTEAFGQIKMLRREFLVLFLMTTLLVVFVAYGMSRSISIPIQTLTDLANRIAAGDLSQTITVDSRDEVGALATSFNRMTEDLRRSRDELVRANEALTHARDQAVQASQLKSHFLANMSHEIRTPMNGVLGMTELLLATGLTHRQHRLAESAYRSGTALLQIINDILDFSKIEAGKLKLDVVDFDLQQVVEETVDMFTERAQRKHLALFCSIPPSLPSSLQGDPGRLRQILINLLGNGLKFTDHGSVGVRFAALEITDSHVLLEGTVSDTGIGIRQEFQAEIFEAFSQADASSTRKYGGTGLGLSIVHQLVSLMHGMIYVRSEAGKGSQFIFTVRFDRPAASTTANAAPAAMPSGHKIMVVDADPAVQTALTRQLIGWGHEAVGVSSGDEAVSRLQRDMVDGAPFHVALLDASMADMETFQLAHTIKSSPTIAATKLIVLSGPSWIEGLYTTHQAGIAAVLHKPAHADALRDVLAKLLRETPSLDDPHKGDTALTSLVGQPALPSGTTGITILIAEDNEVNQELARLMIEQLGHRAIVVGNGRAAVEAMQRSSFDMIFMDCQMPEMDGFAATHAIRLHEGQQPEPSHIPIVALTAHAIEGDREHCIAVGMDDYLSKPFTQAQLASTINRWVTRQAADPDAASPISSTPSVASPELAPGAPKPLQPASPEEFTSGAVIDHKVWHDILKLQQPGRPDVLVTMLTMFLTDSDQVVEQLRQAVTKKDSRKVFELAHAFKSRSGVLGAVKLSGLCKELETRGRSSDLSTASALFTQLVDEFVAVSECFQDEIRRRTTS